MDIDSLLKSFGSDPQLKSRAESMWKMLDDLANNNPDGYKDFIQSNMKSGIEHIQKEKKEKEKKVTYPLSSSHFRYQLVVPLVLYPQQAPGLLLKPTDKPNTGVFFINIFTHDALSDTMISCDHWNHTYTSIFIGSVSTCTSLQTINDKDTKHNYHISVVTRLQQWLEALDRDQGVDANISRYV